MSVVGAGSSESYLDRHADRFQCDKALMTFFPNRRVLVQFVQKGGRRPGPVGFAGTFLSEKSIDVDHLYLNDGQKLEATKGACQLWYARPEKLKSIVCGARVERSDIAIGAVVGFDILGG